MPALSSAAADADFLEAAGLSLTELPGEGRTLFAQRSFVPGQVVLEERPALVASSKEALAEKVFATLREDVTALEPAVCCGQSADDLEGPQALARTVVERYSFTFLDGANVAVFRLFGTVNHACASSEEANCCLSVPYDAGSVAEHDMVRLMAIRPVRIGEPFRMSYLCAFAPAAQLMLLERTHQFTCRCSACRVECFCASERCCAACGVTEAGRDTALKRCGGCKTVVYCSIECQTAHRSIHRVECRRLADSVVSGGEAAFLTAAEANFDTVMSSSEAAMGSATDVLQSPRHPVDRRGFAERGLEESMKLAQRFVERHSVSGVATESEWRWSSWRLTACHPFLFYARSNLVKQAFSRLALRIRFRGAEPSGGCGLVAGLAQQQLEHCLAAALSRLPRLHVELLSLFRDIADLRRLVIELRGLAADLESFGLPEEGQIEEAGLEDVAQWASAVLCENKDLFEVYGEALEI